MREGWRSTTLGEVCTLTKGATATMKAEAGPYPLVVTAEARSNSADYQFEGEAVCVPMVSSTGHGHASLKRVHYQDGKFAVASIITACQEKPGAGLDMKFLWLLLDHRRDELIVPLMKGTANVSLSQKNLATVPLLLPPVEEQRRIVDLLAAVDAAIEAEDALLRVSRGARSNLLTAVCVDAPEVRLDDVATVSQGRGLPKSVQGEQSGEVPWYKIADMTGPGNEYGYTNAQTTLTGEQITSLGGRVVAAGSVVFPRVGAAVKTEKKRLVETEGAVDENHLVLTPRDGIGSETLLATMENVSLTSLVQGGAVPSLNMKLIREARVTWPDRAEEAEGLMRASRVVSAQAHSSLTRLRELRANLLTVLLSGEHEIPDSYDELLAG